MSYRKGRIFNLKLILKIMDMEILESGNNYELVIPEDWEEIVKITCRLFPFHLINTVDESYYCRC